MNRQCVHVCSRASVGRPVFLHVYYMYTRISSSSSSSCSLRVRRFSCSLILKVEFVPPSLLRSSHVPSSFQSVPQCLSCHLCPSSVPVAATFSGLLEKSSKGRSGPTLNTYIYIYIYISDKTMCPEVDSASENEYQGFLLG